MPAYPEVLIVASQDDALACHVYEAASRRGSRCSIVDGPSAARLFTITVDGTGARVSPDIPLFVRASAWAGHDDVMSEDERFLFKEAHATFWAAAMLCKSPVINRPRHRYSFGRLTTSAIASRCGSRAESAHGEVELYVSDPAMALGRLEPPIWGEDIDFRTAELSKLRPKVPARLRTVDADARYEIVSVVGAQAFAATADPRTQRAGLLARGVEIAACFELHFATVTWLVGADGAAPVRVNAEPNMAEVRTCLGDVIERICTDLCQ